MCFFNRKLDRIKQNGDNGMDYFGITALGKWHIVLRGGQRVQVMEERQQMAFPSVETKKNIASS